MTKHATFSDYLILCKPKVVLLMLITAWVGMYLASPQNIPWITVIFATCGIAFAASSGAVFNHILDRKIDSKMMRTETRPIASGRVSPRNAILFSILLTSLALIILITKVNYITAILTFASVFGYAVIYTMYLKRATPQNIVIGGISGAMPPLLGWAAISGNIDPHGLLLVLIIFIWTPPHFWALAIYRVKDYTAVEIPMLSVTHGVPFTKVCLLLYTILLSAVTCLPFAVGMAGSIYLATAMLLNIIFLYFAIRLIYASGKREHSLAIKTFNFSLVYLCVIFSVLIIDHQYGVM